MVSAASYEARAFGIYASMPLAKAYHLCPQAILIKGNLKLYQEVSHKFMDILSDFSPCIEPCGLDEAFLDTSGYEQPFGSYNLMAMAIKERVCKELAIVASIGIAQCKVVAKIASALCKPDGLLEIASGEERRFLAPFPVAKLPGVGEKTELILKNININTVGALASVQSHVIRKYLGSPGLLLHSYANGVDNRNVEAPGESESISKEVTFSRDTRERHFLDVCLHGLCDEVSMELRFQNRRAKCITLKVRYADFETISRQVTSKGANSISRAVYTIARQLLDRVLLEKRKPIRLLGIKASGLLDREQQYCMFDLAGQRWESLDKAIDKIRMKYGNTSIRSGSDISTH